MKSLYKLHLADELGNEKWSQIKKADIQKRHTDIGAKNGEYQANRVLSLVSTIFNVSITLELLDKDANNPALGIKRFKEISRERFLQQEELPKFFAAVAQEPNETIRDYILIELLTGARPFQCVIDGMGGG